MDRLRNLYSISQLDFSVDYVDVYSGTLNAPCQIPVKSIVKQFFFCIPAFALRLLWLRELIGKRLNIKTANGRKHTLRQIKQFEGQIGDRIALFEVWNQNANEIVTGQRDKHLDFALIFKLDNNEKEHNLQLITVVQINSRLGKFYFWVIKPIHRLVMPMIIKRLCYRLRIGC